jgi:hypothetical protein
MKCFFVLLVGLLAMPGLAQSAQDMQARLAKAQKFFVEPLREGEYFAQFQFKGVKHVAGFAILESYDRCGESDYVEINFSDPAKAHIQESVWINDSGEECSENEPQCFRK